MPGNLVGGPWFFPLLVNTYFVPIIFLSFVPWHRHVMLWGVACVTCVGWGSVGLMGKRFLVTTDARNQDPHAKKTKAIAFSLSLSHLLSRSLETSTMVLDLPQDQHTLNSWGGRPCGAPEFWLWCCPPPGALLCELPRSPWTQQCLLHAEDPPGSARVLPPCATA